MAAEVVLRGDGGWRWYRGLAAVVTAVAPTDVDAALREVETAVNTRNLHAAGFLTYEAGAAYGLATHPRPDGELPLLWFGLFEEVVEIDEIGDLRLEIGGGKQSPISNPQSPKWQPTLNETQYGRAITTIKEQIAAGNTYQVNFTFPLTAVFAGEPWAFFRALAAAQPSAYAAYLDIGSHVICSASPELFFQLDGERIWSRPMKGTAVRGLTLPQDDENARTLAASEKNRAENVMIVDMIRNDLGRVATTGSVRVPELFTVERYPTVLQMTSTVTAVTHASVADIFAHIFPCASITGAPKVRTM
jgi:para-aminobenzoate synthetase/4-amino-4-deoxychorismate lyase